MKYKDILKKMTLEEKISLCSGVNAWQTKAMDRHGIPSLFMCDGPHGLRKQDIDGDNDMLGINASRPATCFPTAVTTASSWDTDLIGQIGEAIATEAIAYDVGLVLGPGLNIKRDPLSGRNFEYFSEDPYLSGKLAASFVRRAEEKGVGTCLKHFAFNNQEYSRFNSDSVMDDRTMREIYLAGFEIAVKEGKPSTLMSAYNKINGVHCSDSVMLLKEILRDEWGFEGMVVTDWGGMHDRIKAFKAGCDLSMPGGSDYMEKDVLEAVKAGVLSEEDIDACANRILELVFSKQRETKASYSFDEKGHHRLAARAAEQGAVLLKNEGILPLSENQSIALIGHMAGAMRYQGAGSSHINPTQIVNPIDAMPNASFAKGCDIRGNTDSALLSQAVKLAKEADVAVVFAGLPNRYESEGFDRDDLKMPEGHIRMIESVAAANPNTLVVLLCGGVVELPWIDKVKALLYMGLPGQAGGEAIANLLYGRVNPSGKLTETWPIKYEDCPSAGHFKGLKNAQYREGIYVGYRYYDKAGVKVRFPFGFGLSYTSFDYSNIELDGNRVRVQIKNTGDRPGAELVQLYIKPPQDGLHRPVKELKGFAKVMLEPGQSKSIDFLLDDRSFAVWADGWKIQKGTYTILVGPSSVDLPLSVTIEKDGHLLAAPSWQKGKWYESLEGRPSQEEWEAMLGRKHVEDIPKKGSFTMNNTMEEMRPHSLVMKLAYKRVEKNIIKFNGGKKDYDNPEFRMMMACSVGSPLRSMQISSGIRGELLQGLLDMANGHYLRGLKKILKRKK
jgi:beta-glucosidase